jgi:hypothetical protein
MCLDNRTVEMAKAAGKRDDGDIAMAWCHPFGAGRVFYTSASDRQSPYHEDESALQSRVQGCVAILGGVLEG